MTAFGSIETAIEAIRQGAFDFISKPMNLEELKKTVARVLEQRYARANSRDYAKTRRRMKTFFPGNPSLEEVKRRLSFTS